MNSDRAPQAHTILRYDIVYLNKKTKQKQTRNKFRNKTKQVQNEKLQQISRYVWRQDNGNLWAINKQEISAYCRGRDEIYVDIDNDLQWLLARVI